MLDALKSKLFYISNKGLLGRMVRSIVQRIFDDIGKGQFFLTTKGTKKDIMCHKC
jgi:hypothetical protein